MSKTNIMVVEDSGIVLLDIQKSLKSLGYSVVATASSKDEAIQKADKTQPDLVLMDIRLGEEMGGIEAADYIREHYDIPIVFLTGYADEDTFQRAKITDPSGYILKPFDPKGLHTTIEIALHNHALKQRLRESEERYRALVELSPEAIYVHRDGKFVYTNQAGVKLMGASTPDELLGTPILDRIHPNFHQKVSQRVQKSLSNGSSAPSLEEKFVRMDGNLVDVEVEATPISYEGQPAMLTVVRDVTERKQSEAIMLARYRLVNEAVTLTLPKLLQLTLDEVEILTGSSIGFFHFVDANQISLSLQTWSTNTLDVMCKAEGAGAHYPIDEAGVWVDCVRERAPVIHNDYASLNHRKGMPEGHAEVTRELVVPIMRAEKIVAILGVGNKEAEYNQKDVEAVSLMADLAWDIVERKQTEIALLKSEALYHDLVETAQDLIWQCDSEGNYIYLNPAWETVFGYNVDDMLGKHFSKFQSPEYAARDQKEFELLLQGGSVKGYETVHLAKDRREIYLVFNAKTVYDQDGKVIGARGTAYDVTERKRSEAALQKSEYLLRESQKLARVGHYDLDILAGHWESSESLNELFGIDWEFKTDVDGWLKIIYPDDREMMAAYFADDVLGRRHNFDKEYRIVRIEDGETRWVHGLGMLEFNEAEDPVRMIGSIQDLTERKQAEEALLARTSELEALFSLSTHLRKAQSQAEMLPVVLEEVRRVLRSDTNSVLLLEEDQENFIFALADGSLAPNTGEKFPIENSISGLIWNTGQLYITDDFSKDKNKTQSLKGAENLGPALLAPIHSEAEFLGVLLCARDKENPIKEFITSEKQLLTAIGEMVGNAMRRARLYDDALTRLQHVQALHSIDMAISANMDINIILDVLIAQGIAQLDVDAACILLLDESTHTLEFAAGSGFRTNAVESTRVRLGEGLTGEAALRRQLVLIPNIADSSLLQRTYLRDEGYVTYQAAPLVSKGQLLGVLETFCRKQILPSEEKVEFMETLATQAAIAIDNAHLFGHLQRSNFELELAYDATIEGWSRALELRDQETEGHTLRVTEMTLKLARAMGISGDDIVQIRRGALLHDIGKMGVPDSILLKEGKLTPEEWEEMKKHSEYAFEMLWSVHFLRDSLDIPHFHHEKWDGTGYPRGLMREEIPLPARIFAVADVWDALTSDRPYRKAWTKEKAIEYIRENAGRHFDPQVVKYFLRLIESDEEE